jgi:hypothetical protein
MLSAFNMKQFGCRAGRAAEEKIESFISKPCNNNKYKGCKLSPGAIVNCELSSGAWAHSENS